MIKMYSMVSECATLKIAKTLKGSKEERDVNTSYRKKHILKNNESCILSPWMDPGWVSVNVRQSG